MPQDVNGDARSDLLYRNQDTGAVYRLLMNGTSIAGQGPAYVEPDTAWRIVGDGSLRLVRSGELPAAAYPSRLRTKDIREAAAALAPRERWHRPVPGTLSLPIDTQLTTVAGLVTRLALLSLGSGR